MRSLAPLAFAAALMCGTSALAQTAQPTTTTETGTTSPQASSPATTDTMAPDASTASSVPTTTSPTAVGAGTAAEAAVPAAEATVTAETSVETPAPADANVTTGAAATTTASADTSWAQHDADQDGALSPLEFAMHVDAANTALAAEAKRERFSRAANNGAIKLLNSTADDFSKADKNQDRKVDASELATWQAGGSTSTALTATPATGTAPAPEAATTGAGTATPMPEATPDDGAAPAPDASTGMTPADPAAEPKQADDTMASDTPPKN